MPSQPFFKKPVSLNPPPGFLGISLVEMATKIPRYRTIDERREEIFSLALAPGSSKPVPFGNPRRGARSSHRAFPHTDTGLAAAGRCDAHPDWGRFFPSSIVSPKECFKELKTPILFERNKRVKL